MHRQHKAGMTMLMTVGLLGWATGSAAAAVHIDGQVQAGGGPVAQSIVTLWAASANAPTRLGQATTGTDGHFAISVDQSAGNDTSLYLVASGETGLALLTVLGSKPPAKVTINEMTTVASVWTSASFSTGRRSGARAQPAIAAGNVPNFVDLERAARARRSKVALNSTQTPTMANFATLQLMAGCITRVRADACTSFFAAATGPEGKAPADTWL